MEPGELLEQLSGRGVEVLREGDALRIRSSSPPPADLVAEVKLNKEAILAYLNGGLAPTKCPGLPRGVRLLRYAPKAPPVAIAPISIVVDVGKFITAELSELGARLHNPIQIRGGGSIFSILARLAEVGVELALECPLREETVERSE